MSGFVLQQQVSPSREREEPLPPTPSPQRRGGARPTLSFLLPLSSQGRGEGVGGRGSSRSRLASETRCGTITHEYLCGWNYASRPRHPVEHERPDRLPPRPPQRSDRSRSPPA